MAMAIGDGGGDEVLLRVVEAKTAASRCRRRPESHAARRRHRRDCAPLPTSHNTQHTAHSNKAFTAQTPQTFMHTQQHKLHTHTHNTQNITTPPHLAEAPPAVLRRRRRAPLAPDRQEVRADAVHVARHLARQALDGVGELDDLCLGCLFVCCLI